MEKQSIDWEFCKLQSDEILSEGIYLLMNSKPIKWQEVNSSRPGNYLISNEGKYFYVGEAENLSKRIKQQFAPKTSTFYKNYLKFTGKTDTHSKLCINDFDVQIIEAEIGRAEIEEFGIVNLGTIHNKFQVGKRNERAIACKGGIWELVQKKRDLILGSAEEEVFASNKKSWFDAVVTRTAGLYLVYERSGRLIYIGESTDVNERYSTHSIRTYFSALRRHIGTEILGFTLKEINKKKRYFSETEDVSVTEFLKSCKIGVTEIPFGRCELETMLIAKHNPLLNREGKN